MRKRRRRLVWIVGITVAILAGGFVLRKTGPSFEGEGIYYWSLRMHDPRQSAEEQAKAQEAARKLAPRSMATLLAWLRESEPAYSEPGYVKAVKWLLSWQHSVTVIASVPYQPSRPGLAYQLFMEMGSGAEPAIPALIELLRDKDTEISGKACMILANIGPASIPKVAQLLASTNEMTRAMAAATLGVMGPQARSVAPDLQRMLAEKSNVIRLAAACALVKIETDPRPVIPVLLDCWKQSDFEGRDSALDALGQLKDRALPAVPQLTNLLATAKDAGERQMLLGTLQSIDPKTAGLFAPAPVAEPPESGGQGDRQIDPKQ
jgi:hypothetical protein